MVASRPRYEVLYSGLTLAAQGQLVAELQAEGISANFDVPGQIQVPADKVHEIRMKLAGSGKAPKGSHVGMENLGDLSPMDTPVKERERINAMKEGEVAKDIETNPGVQSAQIHVTLGDPSPFMDRQRPSTASVSLVTAGNGAVSHESARGIAMLVANSFDGLELKHVVVLDERGQALFNGNDIEANDSQATSKLDMEQQIARKEEQRLQGTLDSIFGPGSTRVTVRCEVDMDTKHVKVEDRKVSKGVATKSMIEKMKGDKPVGGPAGAQANMQPTSGSGKGDDNYQNTVETREPGMTLTETEKTVAPGTVKAMVINVAADSQEKKFGDPVKLQALKDFIATEFADRKANKSFVANVTPIAFDDSAKTQIVQAQTEAQSSARLQQIMSMLPIVALLIVGIMVVKQIGKISKNAAANATERYVYQMAGGEGQAPGTYITSNAGEGHEFYHPTGDQHSRNLSRFTEQELAQMTEDGVVFRDNGEIVEVEKIRERKSVHLAAIKQMAKDRPEPTAMLIKTWLAETPTR